MIRKDKSGQIMLISSFMLAIVVVAITLMLNNVIYSSNMAYVGYMDQSRYNDLSYKQATADEAAFAYMNDSANYNYHMSDYVKCLNNLTSAKGGYVELTPITPPDTHPLPITDTKTQLSIYGKDSKTSYTIYTGSSNTAPTPTPTATPLPTSYDLSLSAEKYTFDYGTNAGSNLTVKVTDTNGVVQPNVYVLFTLSDLSLGDVMCIDGVTHIPYNGLATDQNGYVYARFVSTLFAGTETIKAYNGSKNNSNTITLVITQPATNTHTVPDPTITITPVNNNKYTIKLQFDFTGFTGGNVNIISSDISPTDMHVDSPAVYHTAGSYIDMTVKQTGNYNGPYTVTFKLEVTAKYTADGQLYDKIVTYTATGTAS